MLSREFHTAVGNDVLEIVECGCAGKCCGPCIGKRHDALLRRKRAAEIEPVAIECDDVIFTDVGIKITGSEHQRAIDIEGVFECYCSFC